MRHAYDIPASIINLRLSIAVQYGANRDSILEEAGVPEKKLSEPTNRITIDETIEIWKAILNQTGSQEIGLLAGLRGRLQSLGILGYVMMNSNTSKDSYSKLCTYQRLVASMAFQKMEIKNSLIHITLEMQIDWHETFRYTMDFMVASSFSFVREHTVNRITPLKMGFNFEEPDNAERYRELFQPAIVEFGHPQSFLIYRESDFNDSIVNPSNELHEQFKIMLEAAISEHDNYKNTPARCVNTFKKD